MTGRARKKLRAIPKEEVDPRTSSRAGLAGIYESLLRSFRFPVMVGTLVLVFCGVAVILGVALTPAIALVAQVFDWSEKFPSLLMYFSRGTSFVLGYMVFGLCAILVVPVVNRAVMPWVRPFRGPYYSVAVLGWYLHNILTYALRYTFLDWVTPTPFNLFFYRQMGMKIGRRVEINTSNVSDPGLITLEDGVTIGGSATLLAHYAVGGYLIIAPLIIRKGATIGLRAIIMGGVEIGEGARILPNSVVLPKTCIPAGETWGGVPAKRMD